MQINLNIPTWVQPFLYGFAVIIPIVIITAIFGPAPLIALLIFTMVCVLAGVIGGLIMLLMGKEPFDL